MPTTPLANNFIEENNDKEYQDAINMAVDALEEVRNQGSQIFNQLYKNTILNYSLIVQIFYFRKILEIIDSISILVKSQSSPDSLLRSFFESAVYITHIFTKHTDKRALSFIYVMAVENEIRNNKFNPNTITGKETKSALEKDKKGNLLDGNIEFIESANQGLHDLRSKPEFKVIEEEYNRIKCSLNNNSKDNRRPAWYYLFDGSKSFKDLCYHLGFKTNYMIQFDYLSQTVHAQDIIQAAEVFDDGSIQHPLFRNYQEYRTSVNTVFLMSFKIFEFYLKQIPENNINLNQWGLQFAIKYKNVLHTPEELK